MSIYYWNKGRLTASVPGMRLNIRMIQCSSASLNLPFPLVPAVPYLWLKVETATFACWHFINFPFGEWSELTDSPCKLILPLSLCLGLQANRYIHNYSITYWGFKSWNKLKLQANTTPFVTEITSSQKGLI